MPNPGYTEESSTKSDQAPIPELELIKEEETVSIASRHEQPISQAPANVYVITDEDIRHSGATDIPTLLRRVPGMEVMQTSGAEYNVSARGNNQLTANKMLVMVDGRSIYVDTQGLVFWKAIPVTLPEIKRIEVLKGPASVLYGFKDARDVKLKDGVSLYSHLIQPRATYRIDGMTLKEALADLFQSQEYKDAVDADAGQSVTSQGDQSRAAMVASIFHRYSAAIKAEVADASPIALAYMTAAAAKHRDDAYLKAVSLDDLVNNPAIYEAHGVDPEEYSGRIIDGATGQLLQAVGAEGTAGGYSTREADR